MNIVTEKPFQQYSVTFGKREADGVTRLPENTHKLVFDHHSHEEEGEAHHHCFHVTGHNINWSLVDEGYLMQAAKAIIAMKKAGRSGTITLHLVELKHDLGPRAFSIEKKPFVSPSHHEEGATEKLGDTNAGAVLSNFAAERAEATAGTEHNVAAVLKEKKPSPKKAA